MPAVELSQALSETFGEFSYLAPFAVLFLCGIGLPLPEEVTLIGSGILLYRGEVEFVPIVIVCSTAILLGDSIPFWLGRRYGMSALEKPLARRILKPERLVRLRARFQEHGNWATFACRFFAGVRLPGYFLAGTMGMPYARFLLLDALGVVISVPISIYLGKVFGDSVDTLKEKVHDIHLILAFLALSLVLILLVRARRSRPSSGAPAAPPSEESAAATGDSPPPGDG